MDSFMNSPGMWIACSFMVIVVVVQSVIFLRNALKHAPEVGLSKEQVKSGVRSSIITSLGPSLSPVLVMLSLIAALGTPTAWMRMCDIGAGRTELGMATIAAESIGEELVAGAINAKAFCAVLWGMALNNLGWLLVALLCTHRMSGALQMMNTRFNPKWIKLLTAGATFGLFGYLTTNQIVGKTSPYLVAVVAAAITMLIIDRFFGSKRTIRELALGISMIVGMTAATICAGI